MLVSFQWLGDADAAPRAPDPVELEVVDGTYKGSFTLPKGRWQVSAAAPDGAFTTTTVKAVYENIVAKITAVDGQTRVAVESDGELASEAGLILKDGQSETFTATEAMMIRVGNAKSAHIMVDGVDHGSMGKAAEVKTWLLEPGQDPQTVR